MPDPNDLIHQLTLEGAALTIFPEGGSSQTPAFVIASEIALTKNALTYFVAGDSITGNVHRLEFDELRAPHSLGVAFHRDGLWIAYLTSVAEESEEAEAQWQQWQRWLKDNPDAPEAIAAEIHTIAKEGN